MSLESFRLFPHNILWQGTALAILDMFFITSSGWKTHQSRRKSNKESHIASQFTKTNRLGQHPTAVYLRLADGIPWLRKRKKWITTYHTEKQGLTLPFRSQARHQVQKSAEQKWVDSLFQSLGRIIDPWIARKNHLDFSHSAMRNYCLFRVLVLKYEIEKRTKI